MTTYHHMLDELVKLCAEDVTRAEAAGAIKRLRALEKEKITTDDLTRAGTAGALGGGISALARGAASGSLGKGLVSSFKAPGGLKGKASALGKSLVRGVHDSAASSVGSAAFGASMPLIHRHLNREAEKDTLRDYLGENRGTGIRRKAKKYLGV